MSKKKRPPLAVARELALIHTKIDEVGRELFSLTSEQSKLKLEMAESSKSPNPRAFALPSMGVVVIAKPSPGGYEVTVLNAESI